MVSLTKTYPPLYFFKKIYQYASTWCYSYTHAWFAGKKVGEWISRTRKESQNKVVECSIKQLVGSIYGDVSGFHGSNNNGFASSGNSIGNKLLSKKELVSFSTAFESSKISDPRLKVSKMSTDSIFALEELVSFLVNKETNCGRFIHVMLCQSLLLIYYKFFILLFKCMMEGLIASFQSPPTLASTYFAQKDEVLAQVCNWCQGYQSKTMKNNLYWVLIFRDNEK